MSTSTAQLDQADVFARDGFDVTGYINEMFPSEDSLVGLDPLIGNLKQKIRRVDGDILMAVRQQSSSGNRARQDLSKAKLVIEDLFVKTNEIRRKAEQSEVMVQEICRDIKKLDYAKQHLTHTITALRRLAMLVTAVDQLQRSTERQEYGECAHLLEAVQQLAGHFSSFVQIPKVAELSGRLSALQKSLQMNVQREFELLGVGEDKPNPLLLDRLRACCLVVDALGFSAREDLIDRVCKKEMGVYAQIFSSTGETASLDRMERRYNWLRKRLKAREEVWAVFPESWRVPQLLCLMFCNITKTQLAEILDSKAAELGGNVEGLLIAVKSTRDFEAEMAQKFGGGPAQPEAEDEDRGLDEGDDNSPASRVRQRYERMFREKQRVGEDSLAMGGSHPPQAASETAARTAFPGSVSSVFTPHLHVYVDAEERGLRERLDVLVREETWKAWEDAQQTNVLRSSSELFAEIKKSLQRCSKFVSKGPALFQLCTAFQRQLQAYAGKLVGRLPKTNMGLTTGTATAGSADWQVKLVDEDVPVICTIIATAEYCGDVVGALGRSIAKMLDPPFGQQVDVMGEEDEFQAVITSALNVLLLGLETRLEASLTQMARISWSSLESVGDQSDFVNSFSKTLSELGPKIGSALNDNHFRFFCDKLANSLAPRFFEAIFRCRKIGEAGSQQLLLDTQAIKGLLLEFPTAGRPNSVAAPSFATFVGREMGKAEALLKVVGSRPENLVENFFTLMPAGAAPDFQRVIELKVLRRQEQQSLVEAFSRRIGRGHAAGSAGTGQPAASTSASGAQARERPPRQSMSDPTREAAQLPGVSGGAGAALAASSAGPAAAGLPSSGTPPPLRPTASSSSFTGATGLSALSMPRGTGPPPATGELSSRFRFGANTAAARAQAVAGSATDRMRESFAAMKNINLGFSRRSEGM
ncbi:hypothetical protein WJX84_000384 [Apatococcus fuscideae]|uniref:Vps53 N-terminal domain-containing protein n=1 Tax=Apatococcus fuscideae TaxID=2026836 RepID=A0AAW1SVG2_9CHLO